MDHNFGYRHASKSIKGSIDADFDIVFNKTLSQKKQSIGWGPGPAKISKTPPLMTVPPAIPPPKSISIRRLVESVKGLNSSLALAAGVIAKKVSSTIVAPAGRNGFKQISS